MISKQAPRDTNTTFKIIVNVFFLQTTKPLKNQCPKKLSDASDDNASLISTY